ncbi:hypothetical protein [Streptomyces hokutonensis]|uniref:Uncharacterized protein n=1 Tax=Streptomyces hokutonensis TaxID=1306990 RepID=A0ABW6ME30_9ACTN
MTATATLDEIVCLRPSTSTDFCLSGVIDGADHAVWPSDSTFSAAAGAQIPLGIQLTVDGSQEVFLWDQDDVSADDLLGSVTISEDEQGGGSLSKLAHSEEERSYYYVQYHVD